jgi:hypothetical protein
MHWLHITAAGLALGYLGTQVALGLIVRHRWSRVLAAWREVPPPSLTTLDAWLAAELLVAIAAHRCTVVNCDRALAAIQLASRKAS